MLQVLVFKFGQGNMIDSYNLDCDHAVTEVRIKWSSTGSFSEAQLHVHVYDVITALLYNYNYNSDVMSGYCIILCPWSGSSCNIHQLKPLLWSSCQLQKYEGPHAGQKCWKQIDLMVRVILSPPNAKY